MRKMPVGGAAENADALIQIAQPSRSAFDRHDIFHCSASSSSGGLRARHPARVGTARLPRRHQPARSNASVVFNIRISTEVEINGTVKGSV
jgi:hypothetical protein